MVQQGETKESIESVKAENKRLREALVIMGRIAESALNIYEMTDEKLAALRRQILNYLARVQKA